MNALHYYPWAARRDWLNEFSKVFATAGNDCSSTTTTEWAPAVDIEEYADKFVLYADVPGVDLASVDVTLEKSVLTLSGSREPRAEQAGVEARRSERASGRFQRRFTLPDTADSEGVSASGKNGVLEIVIPKRQQTLARKITVKH
ncbi:MAG: Hsp20/alpha crystallin family protein [Stenotrophobium sp.]